MKTKNYLLVLCVVIIVTVICITQAVINLAWWSFVMPVMVLGAFIRYRKWLISSFPVGALAGFFTWAGVNGYFEQRYHSLILHKMASVYNFPFVVFLLIAGLLGGLLTGLALYTGERAMIFYQSIGEKNSDNE
jgi:hypothetical protein